LIGRNCFLRYSNMKLFAKEIPITRERFFHYLLVAITFAACYLVFGYWNLAGNGGAQYGYGCYDGTPIKAPASKKRP